MTPLEEQVEKVARELNLEAGRQRGLSDVDDWDYITEQERGGWRNMAKTAIAVLLPLEVTDESAVALTKGEIEAILAPHDGMRPDTPEARRDTRTGTAKLHAALSAALTQKGDNE